MDGEIIEDNLQHINLDRQWLLAELNKLGVNDYTKVGLAELDTSGNLLFSNKQ